MQPNKNNILHFVYRATQYFQIPDFQRPYTWDTAIVEAFLHDLEHVRESSRNHYFGTVVYVPEADHFTVIDGQQRLTTTLLMMVAIYHILREHPEKSSDFKAENIKEDFLSSKKYGAAEKDRKILLRTVTTDNEVFKKIFEDQKLTADETANRQKKTYDQFRRYFLQREQLETYVRALERFEIITVALDANDDKPQLIFESINSTGAPLSSGDKIRNYSLMLNSENARRHVYDRYWSRIERTLTRRDGNKLVDDITGFYRHFLQCKGGGSGKSISEADTYTRFKSFFNDTVGHEHAIDRLNAYYEDLLVYLDAYCFIRYGDDPHSHFSLFREYNFRFQYLEFAQRISFLMDALVAYSRNEITQQETLGVYKALEIFIVRRLMCNMGTGGMNNMLPTWFKQVQQLRKRHSNSVFDDVFKRYVLDGRGRTRVFPSDAEIRSAVENYPMGTYPNRLLNYLLACIEDSVQPKESRLLSQISKGEIKLSLEHIMPQTLSPVWKKALGNNAETIHETWLNRLANITLTGYNSAYSNKPFTDKKACTNGFVNSPLNINRYIAKYEAWDEVALKKREAWLTKRILKEWPTLTSTIAQENEPQNGRYALSDIDPKRRKPARVEINGARFEVSTWKEFTETICKQLYQLDADLFDHLLDDDDFARPRGGRLVSDSPEKLARPCEIASNIFIEVNLSANDLHDLALKIAERYELEDEIFYEIER